MCALTTDLREEPSTPTHVLLMQWVRHIYPYLTMTLNPSVLAEIPPWWESGGR